MLFDFSGFGKAFVNDHGAKLKITTPFRRTQECITGSAATGFRPNRTGWRQEELTRVNVDFPVSISIASRTVCSTIVSAGRMLLMRSTDSPAHTMPPDKSPRALNSIRRACSSVRCSFRFASFPSQRSTNTLRTALPLNDSGHGEPLHTRSNISERIVSSPLAFRSAAFRSSVSTASREAMNRVPMRIPLQPSVNAAANPRPSAIPPAATTGMSAPTASTIAGASDIVPPEVMPWPPASWPCATMISAQ